MLLWGRKRREGGRGGREEGRKEGGREEEEGEFRIMGGERKISVTVGGYVEMEMKGKCD